MNQEPLSSNLTETWEGVVAMAVRKSAVLGSNSLATTASLQISPGLLGPSVWMLTPGLLGPSIWSWSTGWTGPAFLLFKLYRRQGRIWRIERPAGVSLNLSFTWNTLGHLSKRAGRCSSMMFVWNVLIVSGLWTLPRQTFPTMTHHRSNFCA